VFNHGYRLPGILLQVNEAVNFWRDAGTTPCFGAQGAVT
jgi:hypothetical protein